MAIRLKRQTLLGMAMVLALPTLAGEPDIVVTGERMKIGWKSVSGEIPFGDLNLASDRGAATLRQRMEAEVRKLCAAAASAAERRECQAMVLASARPQVDRLVADARGDGLAPPPDMR